MPNKGGFFLEHVHLFWINQASLNFVIKVKFHVDYAQIWQSVKEANPSLSVCEIGATIGKMWRELDDVTKQKYNEDFVQDKVSPMQADFEFCPLIRWVF